MVLRLAKPLDLKGNFVHAALGVTSEAGELADAVKSSMVYGKPLDLINMVEECGDLLWFTALALTQLGLTLEDAKRANAAKLNVRYQAGFSAAAALGRKKDLEREAIANAIWGRPTAPSLEELGIAA
jgi:NTP pyrophosphatase (non-canonical NTP hydrolase)